MAGTKPGHDDLECECVVPSVPYALSSRTNSKSSGAVRRLVMFVVVLVLFLVLAMPGVRRAVSGLAADQPFEQRNHAPL
jgi:hypothetical protein